MQIVPRLATLGRVELMMTRPADVVAADDNFRNYLKSRCRGKVPRRPFDRAVFGVGLGRVNRLRIASMWLWMTLAAQPRQTYRKHGFIVVRLGRNIPVVGDGDLASNIKSKAHAAIAARD
jgi:hypothetical protein